MFHAPAEVLDIIKNFTPVAEPSKKGEIDTQTASNIPLDENGDVDIDDEHVIGVEQGIFGEKIYGDIEGSIEDVIQTATGGTEEKKPSEVEQFKREFHEKVIQPVIDKAKEHYGTDMRRSDEKQIDRKLTTEASGRIEKAFGDFNIQKRTIEQERQDALENMDSIDVRL